MSVRVLEVIETKLTKRGDGVAPGDPVRIITQYWCRETGVLLAEHDPFTDRHGVDGHGMPYSFVDVGGVRMFYKKEEAGNP